jgi:hypothetical protein
MSIVALCVLPLGSLNAAFIAPVLETVDDPRCDPISGAPPEELGTGFVRPERIASSAVLTPLRACVADNGIPGDDWLVSITNLSGRRWVNLGFIADVGNTVGNADGLYGGVADVFRIDTAVANAPLVAESINPDLIFQVGETWTFIVNDFVVTAGPAGPPVFGSVGVGPFSAVNPRSNASIVVLDPSGVLDPNPIPEPTTVVMFAIGLAGIAVRQAKARTH